MNDLLHTTTIRISPTVIATAAAQTVIPSQLCNNNNNNTKKLVQSAKRPADAEIDCGATKRSKTSSTTITLMNFQPTATTTTTPHLLQQLITAPQQPIQLKLVKQEEVLSAPPQASVPQQQTAAATNSVLMNLLVSGCDVSAGYTCFPRPSKAAKA